MSDKLTKFEKLDAGWNSDPAADLFPNIPQEAGGRRLEAELTVDLKDYLVIKLRVQRSSGKPLEDDVIFLLHPTFDEPTLHKKPQ